jgi:hypothetical protein
MKSLPDPRSYVAVPADSLAGLASAAASGGIALQQSSAGHALVAEVGRLLGAGQEDEIRDAFRRPASAEGSRALDQAVDAVLARAADAPLALRRFAFPIVLVAGGLAPGKIPGVVPQIDGLRELLALHGALGQAAHAALHEALADEAGIEALRLARLYETAQDVEGASAADLQPEPSDIVLQSTEETAHLRFLFGATLTPRDAPDLAETAANIGAWGLPWTRALASRLAQPGLSLLPVPRPPLPPRQALQAGRFVWREIGFQLFLSATLREYRARIGEPDVSVASVADGSVRVRLGSALDDTSSEFRWPLAQGDDLAAVDAAIFGLLAECRLDNVQVADTVQPVPASH